MRENFIAVGLLLLALVCWTSIANANINNEVLKKCVEENRKGGDFDSIDFIATSKCYNAWKIPQIKAKNAELRDFLKHNPRYRVPGQALNRCWGKPREMPFESAYIKQTESGFEAGVSYKDTLPAGCYENAPWDNRDAKR